MTRKPEIQYVGQFYVHGSEARKLEVKPEKKTPRHPLPIAKLEKMEKVYVDPVAIVAMAVAVFMLVTMFLGLRQLQTDWVEYQTVRQYVHRLKEDNHEKTEAFRAAYDLEDIRAKATAMGMIPKAEAESIILKVTSPVREPEMTWLDEVRWFVGGLFA